MTNTPSVTESWIRIETWMEAHAPVSRAMLAAPAAGGDVAALESLLGVELPAQLRESLDRHDGLTRWANIFPERPPLGAKRIGGHWEMCMDILDDLGEGGDSGGEPWWHPLWIPFAESDGDSQIIDLREGPDRGRMGWNYHDEGGVFDGAWPDLAAYLHAVAESLHGGGPVGGAVPYLFPGKGELWWAPEGAEDVNGRPIVPAPRG